jgi:hypothetical protein
VDMHKTDPQLEDTINDLTHETMVPQTAIETEMAATSRVRLPGDSGGQSLVVVPSIPGGSGGDSSQAVLKCQAGTIAWLGGWAPHELAGPRLPDSGQTSAKMDSGPFHAQKSHPPQTQRHAIGHRAPL